MPGESATNLGGSGRQSADKEVAGPLEVEASVPRNGFDANKIERFLLRHIPAKDKNAIAICSVGVRSSRLSFSAESISAPSNTKVQGSLLTESLRNERGDRDSKQGEN